MDTVKAIFPIAGNNERIIDALAIHYDVVADLQKGFFILTASPASVEEAMQVLNGGVRA